MLILPVRRPPCLVALLSEDGPRQVHRILGPQLCNQFPCQRPARQVRGQRAQCRPGVEAPVLPQGGFVAARVSRQYLLADALARIQDVRRPEPPAQRRSYLLLDGVPQTLDGIDLRPLPQLSHVTASSGARQPRWRSSCSPSHRHARRSLSTAPGSRTCSCPGDASPRSPPS